MPISSPNKNQTAIRTNIILFLLLIFSFILRAWHLDTNPAGFFCDEASVGFNAYSILTSGKDEFGVSFPIFFRSLDDYKPPLYIYLTSVSVEIFGLNEYAVRFPAVFFGSLTVLVFYQLLRFFASKKTALIGSLLLSISPWHIQMSRIGWDGQILWVLLTIISTNLFLKAITTKNHRFLIASFISFAINFYSYRASWIFTPLYMLLLFSIYKKSLLKYLKTFYTGALIFLVILIPLFLHISTPQGWLRFQATTNLSFPLTKQVSMITTNYLNYFSLNYLFTKGDSQFSNQLITRHSIIGLGELYLWQLPFLLIGLVSLIKFPDKRKALIILSWLFLYPLAGSLTSNSVPYATRSLIGVIPLTIISVIWFDPFHRLIKKRRVYSYLTGSLLIIIFSFSLFQLIVKLDRNPLFTSDFWGWQFGPRVIIGYFKEVETNYDELIMEPRFNAPYIFFKFYAPNACKNCFLGTLKSYNKDKQQLFALSKEYLEDHPSLNYETKKEIFYPDGNLAFKIIEIKN